MSYASIFGRVGAILAPFVVQIGSTNPNLALVIFAVPCLVSGALGMLLPETRGKASMETLHDLSCLVALPSPVKTLGSGWRSSFRASDGMLACERA